jgi:GntR family transcriptional regulator / MocR family aminotransferase
MAKTRSALDLGAITLDTRGATPLHQQVYDALRQAILSKQLKPGLRLPSTRAIATDLGVSRNTVVAGFDQLLAEGYIESRVGAGSYVSRHLPDELLSVRGPAALHPTPQPASRAPRVSTRVSRVLAAPRGGCGEQINAMAFRTGIAALDEFPIDVWARLVARRSRAEPASTLAYGDAAGYRPLREAIAEYLGTARGLSCTADQVIITAASQEALMSIAQVTLDDGDEVLMEDPGYQGARSALLAAGARLVPVPVDPQGMVVEQGVARAPNAKLAYVTPSYQYPLGVTMSLARRLALLDWANRNHACIIEDDYNSEYRYTGRPLAALMALDTQHRVIYVGTFSKVMFSALRVGYMVVPPHCVDLYRRVRAWFHQYLSTLDQAVLTDFIVDGHFARHIRRMRALYAERRALLSRLLDEAFDGRLQIDCAEAGLHVLVRLPDGVDDVAVSLAAAKAGIEAQPLSSYAIVKPGFGGLVLGYGALNERKIRDGVRKLRQALLPVLDAAAGPSQ